MSVILNSIYFLSISFSLFNLSHFSTLNKKWQMLAKN